MSKRQDIDKTSCEAIEALRNAGGKVYIVGGFVRDRIIGIEPKDVDLLVTGLPSDAVQEVLESLGGRVDYTGKSFGVFRYKKHGNEVEIALPRQEISTGVGHKEFNVRVDHKLSVKDDLWRRDFTMNAIAIDTDNDKIIDPYGGINDLLGRKIKQVNPESISEDPIRILRAIVLNSRFGFKPDVDTKFAMIFNSQNILNEAPERIRYEVDKIFESDNPARGIDLAMETGVLEYFLPEVYATVGYDQNNRWHNQLLYDHMLSVLRIVSTKTEDPDVRLAALLHDIGKPKSEWLDPDTGYSHFYKKVLDDGTQLGHDHAEIGWIMTAELMHRLKYSNDRIKRVSGLVKHHMYNPFISAKSARKFLAKVGDLADDLLIIRYGDQGGKDEYRTDPDEDNFSIKTERILLEKIRDENQPTDISQLAINGKDLIEAGYPQGPSIGRVLNDLVERVLDDPSINNRDDLLAIAVGPILHLEGEAHGAAVL